MRKILKNILTEMYERDLPELIERDIKVNIDTSNNILAIIGPRRSGKTYFMFQIMKQLLDKYSRDDFLFIDFEDYRLIPIKNFDIDELLRSFYELFYKEPKFLFFDEIQNLPHFSRILRTLHNSGKYRIIISGSSSKLLSNEIATELRGRYKSILMLPFSFKEVLKFHNVEITPLTEFSIKIGEVYNLFDEYIQFGGFPEIVKTDDKKEKISILENYYSTMFYNDILERYNVKLKYLVEIMMKYMLSSYSSIFSVTSFAKKLKTDGYGISKRTIANYLYYLKEIFFTILVDKFSFSPAKRNLNPKKVYLIDNGFIALADNFSENRGLVLENLVATHLLRQNKQFYYYKNSYECDFVVKAGLKINSAIQVSYSIDDEKTRRREINALLKTMAQFNLRDGKILTYETEDSIKMGERNISIIPVWKYLIE